MIYMFKSVNDAFAQVVFEDGPDIEILEILRNGEISTGWTTLKILSGLPASIVGYNASERDSILNAIKQGEIEFKRVGNGAKALRDRARLWEVGAQGRGEIELIIDKYNLDF